jgi:acyl-CoA thioester hydrolase
MRVEPGWIDYNGHMNMAYYHVLFDRTSDQAFDILGLGPEYVETREASIFVGELHTLYKRELTLQDVTRTTLQLIDFDEKRIHYYMEIRHAEEGWVAATAEHLSLHVDMATRKVAPFPDDILANLAVMKAAHGPLMRPPSLGRIIGVPGSNHSARPKELADTRH